MSTPFTKSTTHEELLRSVLPERLSDEDALLWMVLLHTHAIHLSSGANANDRADNQDGGTAFLHALTQREAASVIAALWPDRTDQRADSVYWYFQFNTRTPYEVLSAVPKELMTRLLEFRSTLAGEPRVAAVIEED